VRVLSIVWLMTFTGWAQTRPPEMTDEFRNLDFAAGQPGEKPVGWHLGSAGTRSYNAETVAGADCREGKRCVVIRSTGLPPDKFCFLYQIVDAKQYRGKKLTFRAAVRTDLRPGSVARLLVRIHRENGNTSFRDDMGDRPITAGPWTFYEMTAPVIFDARDIEFGIQVFGEGSAWIDGISMNFSSVH